MRNTNPAKPAITIMAAMVLLFFANLSFAASKEQLCKTDIKALIKTYEQALNRSDTDKVLQLYARDGVFMPSNKPTSQGQTQVRKAYQRVFRDLDLDVTFHIDEIVWRDDIAFVRTTSDGKIKLLTRNTTVENHSRELFVVKRIDDEWKIYRYIFNETG